MILIFHYIWWFEYHWNWTWTWFSVISLLFGKLFGICNHQWYSFTISIFYFDTLIGVPCLSHELSEIEPLRGSWYLINIASLQCFWYSFSFCTESFQSNGKSIRYYRFVFDGCIDLCCTIKNTISQTYVNTRMFVYSLNV